MFHSRRGSHDVKRANSRFIDPRKDTHTRFRALKTLLGKDQACCFRSRYLKCRARRILFFCGHEQSRTNKHKKQERAAACAASRPQYIVVSCRLLQTFSLILMQSNEVYCCVMPCIIVEGIDFWGVHLCLHFPWFAMVVVTFLFMVISWGYQIIVGIAFSFHSAFHKCVMKILLTELVFGWKLNAHSL